MKQFALTLHFANAGVVRRIIHFELKDSEAEQLIADCNNMEVIAADIIDYNNQAYLIKQSPDIKQQ